MNLTKLNISEINSIIIYASHRFDYSEMAVSKNDIILMGIGDVFSISAGNTWHSQSIKKIHMDDFVIILLRTDCSGIECDGVSDLIIIDLNNEQ